MNTTKLNNGLTVLAWEQDGDAKTFVNRKQVERWREELLAAGWMVSVWKSPNSPVRYLTIDTTTNPRLPRIEFALKDIRETLAIWRDDKPIDDPYIVKLMAERDELLTEYSEIVRREGGQ